MPLANVWILQCCNAPGVKDQTQQLNATIISRCTPIFKLVRWASKLRESWFSAGGVSTIHPDTWSKSIRGLYLEYQSQTNTTHMSCPRFPEHQYWFGWFSIAVGYLGQFWTVVSFSEEEGRVQSKLTLFLGFSSLGGSRGGLCVSATMETLHWSVQQ